MASLTTNTGGVLPLLSLDGSPTPHHLLGLAHRVGSLAEQHERREEDDEQNGG